MILRKQLAAVTTTADDAVGRLEAESARLRETIDTAAYVLAVSLATVAAAVLLGAFVSATGRP